MKLYTNPATPFGRKAQVIAHELGLKLEIVKTLPVQDAEFRRVNPLGKIPALVLDDGSVIFDSPVICEYLNHSGGGKFFPGTNIFRNNSGRWKALVLQALGDGIAEAAVAYVVLLGLVVYLILRQARANPLFQSAIRKRVENSGPTGQAAAGSPVLNPPLQ